MNREARARDAQAPQRGQGAAGGVPSPCISVCRIDPDSGLCEGCLRTLDEIARWSSLDDVARRAVWAAIAQRRDAPGAQASAARLPASLRFIERDWLSSNQIVGIENGEAVVIDSGYVKHAPLTVELVRRVLQEAQARLVRVVNTHLHSDHCGGNAALARTFGCSITIAQASADEVAAWDEKRLSFAATGQRCPRFAHDATIAPGDTLRFGGLRWRALAAPGHDPKSLIFHCESERLLISADALWEHGFGVLFSEIDGDSGFDEQAAVLDLIESLRVDFVLPGHGRAFGDVGAALARARAKLAALRSDPRRHARHALKVLVKFLLLDLERIEIGRLAELVRDAAVLRRTASQIDMEYESALAWAADELVAQRQLRREGEWLLNV